MALLLASALSLVWTMCWVHGRAWTSYKVNPRLHEPLAPQEGEAALPEHPSNSGWLILGLSSNDFLIYHALILYQYMEGRLVVVGAVVVVAAVDGEPLALRRAPVPPDHLPFRHPEPLMMVGTSSLATHQN